MSKVRTILQGPVSDHEAFMTSVKKALAFVEENEPGTVVYECFADESSGRALWHEMFTDEDAWVTHITNMTETGILPEMLEVLTPDQVTVVTSSQDPRVLEIAQQFGAVRLHGVGGFVR